MTIPIVPSITDEQLAALEMHAELSLPNERQCVATFGELRGLIARLRAAEKDAARYRFVRCGGTKPGFLSSDPERAFFIDEYLVCESVMDARIDTAMEQSK